MRGLSGAARAAARGLIVTPVAALALAFAGPAEAQLNVMASPSDGRIAVVWNGAGPLKWPTVEIIVEAERYDHPQWYQNIPTTGGGSWVSPRTWFPGRYEVTVQEEGCYQYYVPPSRAAICERYQSPPLDATGTTWVAVPNGRPTASFSGVRTSRNYRRQVTNIRAFFRVCDDSAGVKFRAVERYRYRNGRPVTKIRVSRYVNTDVGAPAIGWYLDPDRIGQDGLYLHRGTQDGPSTEAPECSTYRYNTKVPWIGRRGVGYYTITVTVRDEDEVVSLPVTVNMKAKL